MYPMTLGDKNDIYYHIVANQYRVHKRIAEGNQKVAVARLEDGLFYYNQDADKTLSQFGDELHNVGFHPKAGSYVEKKERVAKIVSILCVGKIPAKLEAALKLIKNDKATALGREFPTLEGIIGRAYAKREGVDTDVADLLASHYLPYEPNGEIPATNEGVILSLADKIDSLVTLAQVEKLPEGSHDPFEIRKTVYRILTLLTKSELSVDLADLLKKVSSSETTKMAELLSYIGIRFEQLLLEEGIPQWIAHNVALGTSGDIGKKHEYAKKLAILASKEETKDTLIETFKRVTNILDKNSTETLKISTVILTEPADTALASFIQQHQQALMPQDILEVATLLRTFFESVMVMDPNLELRNARIGMLNTIRDSLREYFAISFT
jgi:glycyl-tRNA synthetase beta chain